MDPRRADAEDRPGLRQYELGDHEPNPDGDNIASVVFTEHEGSYLAGALAAQVTTDTSIAGISADPIIGVIGVRKSPAIDKFIAGYIQRATAINPDIEVKVACAESFGDRQSASRWRKP